MSKEDYVSYDLARRLKEVEFEEHCKNAYLKIGRKVKLLYWGTAAKLANDMGGEYVSAPNLWQAQKWLREKWGIYAYCEPNCLKKWFARAIDLAKNEDLLFNGEMFDNFEKATEYAIFAALELIKKGE